MHPKNNSILSSVSGNPSRVCRCDNIHIPQCRNISYSHFSRSYYPGETISVSVVVVGGDLGATPGMVYARFQPPHTSSILKPSTQYNQWIDKSQCTLLIAITLCTAINQFLLEYSWCCLQSHILILLVIIM